MVIPRPAPLFANFTTKTPLLGIIDSANQHVNTTRLTFNPSHAARNRQTFHILLLSFLMLYGKRSRTRIAITRHRGNAAQGNVIETQRKLDQRCFPNITARRPPKLTLTFKLVRARDQTRLPCEFGANLFSGSRDISHTNKKVSAKKTEPYAVHCYACGNKC